MERGALSYTKAVNLAGKFGSIRKHDGQPTRVPPSLHVRYYGKETISHAFTFSAQHFTVFTYQNGLHL